MYDLTYRPRRLRTSPEMRDLVRETTLDTTDLIYPLFIVPGEGIKKEIDTLPGQYQLSVDEAVKVAQEAYDLGIRGVEIFGIPTYKDEQGSSAWDMSQPVQQAIKAIREAVPNLLVIADVCLCQYTSTGHCGMIDHHEILNDETLPLLCKVAVSQAQAGAHMVAPSDMMDGRVGAIREALDEAGFINVSIMSYAAKLAVYNVSGEYAMVKTAAAAGLIDEQRLVMETMLSMKRAGAKIIITYHALEVARWLKQ